MSTSNDPLSAVLCGVSGEYFVAAELSRRGYVASITLRNTRGIDIVAANADASRSVGIQVKTNQNRRAEWILNQKAETFYSDTLFYIFVSLKGVGERPDFYIVPSKDLAMTVKTGHQAWLSRPGRGGRAHKDNPVRQFKDPGHNYLERWDKLGL